MSIAKIYREMVEAEQQRIKDRTEQAAKGGRSVFISNPGDDCVSVSIYGLASNEIYARVVQVLNDLDKEIQAANRG